MSQAIFYKWCSKYGGRYYKEGWLKRSKELKLENAKFKRMYVENELKLQIAKGCFSKKVLKPSAKREMALKPSKQDNASIAACYL